MGSSSSLQKKVVTKPLGIHNSNQGQNYYGSKTGKITRKTPIENKLTSPDEFDLEAEKIEGIFKNNNNLLKNLEKLNSPRNKDPKIIVIEKEMVRNNKLDLK